MKVLITEQLVSRLITEAIQAALEVWPEEYYGEARLDPTAQVHFHLTLEERFAKVFASASDHEGSQEK